jgi:hypothetical protein
MNIPFEIVCQMLGERDVSIRLQAERIAALEKELAALKEQKDKA